MYLHIRNQSLHPALAVTLWYLWCCACAEPAALVHKDKLQGNNSGGKKDNSKSFMLIYLCNSSHGSYLFANSKAKGL